MRDWGGRRPERTAPAAHTPGLSSDLLPLLRGPRHQGFSDVTLMREGVPRPPGDGGPHTHAHTSALEFRLLCDPSGQKSSPSGSLHPHFPLV